jgi:DNA-binding SARP family transcriptional activator
MYTTFTHRLCRALLNKGDTQTAIRLLTKLTAHNELDEETIKLLMKALALQKNKEALMRKYLQYTETLNKELDIGPSQEVASFYSQLLSELDTQNTEK